MHESFWNKDILAHLCKIFLEVNTQVIKKRQKQLNLLSFYPSSNYLTKHMLNIRHHGFIDEIPLASVTTYNRANSFTPRFSQIGKITTTDQLCIMKSRTIKDTHYVPSPNHVLPS